MGVAVDLSAGGYRPVFSATDIAGGAGVASVLARLEEAPIPCATWTTVATGIASGSFVPFPDAGVCYRFVAVATDRVGNVSSRTSEQLRYGIPDDVTPPVGSLALTTGSVWTKTVSVTLAPSATEIICTLGAGDQLVAVEK